jgi:hypothetical protein
MGSQLLYRYGVMFLVVFCFAKTVGLDVKEINSLGDIPLIGFAFPLVVYSPDISSLKLGCFKLLASKLHSSMTGLIVVFLLLAGL